MKTTIKVLILVLLSSPFIPLQRGNMLIAQPEVGFTAGDSNSVAGREKDMIHVLLGVSDLHKLFSTSYNFSIYAPVDTLWVRIANDTNTTAGGMIPVLPGISQTIKNLDPMYQKYISIIGWSTTSSRKKYYWEIGGE